MLVIRRNLIDEDNGSLRFRLEDNTCQMLLAALAKTTYCGFVFSSLGPETELRVENVSGTARTVPWTFLSEVWPYLVSTVATCPDASSAFLVPPRVTLTVSASCRDANTYLDFWG